MDRKADETGKQIDKKTDKKMDAVKDGHRKTNRLVTVKIPTPHRD